MVMYDNEFEKKEIKFKPRIKMNYNTSFAVVLTKSTFFMNTFDTLLSMHFLVKS